MMVTNQCLVCSSTSMHRTGPIRHLCRTYLTGTCPLDVSESNTTVPEPDSLNCPICSYVAQILFVEPVPAVGRPPQKRGCELGPQSVSDQAVRQRDQRTAVRRPHVEAGGAEKFVS